MGRGLQGGKKPTQSRALVELAADAEFFHTPDGDAYATMLVAEHRETWSIRYRGFRQWLVRQFYEQEGKPPSSQALQEALGVLGARAQFDGPKLPVHVRLAEHEGTIYLDLCNDVWEVVKIGADGWKVVADPPVKFRRAKGMLKRLGTLEAASIRGIDRIEHHRVA